jgi:hypothetical protein
MNGEKVNDAEGHLSTLILPKISLALAALSLSKIRYQTRGFQFHFQLPKVAWDLSGVETLPSDQTSQMI